MLRPAASLKQAAGYRKVWGGGCAACSEQGGSGGGSSHSSTSSGSGGGGFDGGTGDMFQAHCVSPAAAEALVPGVRLAAAEEAEAAAAVAAAAVGSAAGGGGGEPGGSCAADAKRRANKRGGGGGGGAPPAPADAAACAALHAPAGVTLHPARYMRALWAACGARAAARRDGSAARLEVRQLASVAELHAGPGGPYAGGVVVAAGAAVGALDEFRAAGLPLDNCQGYTLDVAPPRGGAAAAAPGAAAAADAFGGAAASAAEAAAYPTAAPSLLGSPYIASQGGALLVVGATKAHGWGGDACLAECGRAVDTGAYQGVMAEAAAALAAGSGRRGGGGGGDDVAAAVWELLAGGGAAWPPLLGWRLAGIRSGVRALPPRTAAGSIPLMGAWRGGGGGGGGCGGGSGGASRERGSNGSGGGGGAAGGSGGPPTWLYVGLGARGLVYHAWLGAAAARAALSGDEAHLPPEALAWRRG
jgi:hypothetical protein